MELCLNSHCRVGRGTAVDAGVEHGRDLQLLRCQALPLTSWIRTSWPGKPVSLRCCWSRMAFARRTRVQKKSWRWSNPAEMGFAVASWGVTFLYFPHWLLGGIHLRAAQGGSGRSTIYWQYGWWSKLKTIIWDRHPFLKVYNDHYFISRLGHHV